MNATRAIVLTLTALVAVALPLAAQQPQQIVIPPQVASLIDAGLAQKQGRMDIPMAYLNTLYLPAQQGQVYPVFFFQLKNADLGFAAPADNPALLKSAHYLFLRVYRLAPGAAPAVARERNARFDLEEAQAAYQPEALNYYTLAGDIYPAGDYRLALAVTTPDYAKISVVYADFTLPDHSQLKDRLATTPVISVLNLQMLPAADSRLTAHKNSFVYNTLMLEPKMNDEFKAGDSLDLFYFIIGATSDQASGAINAQITYTFKKDGKEVNKLAPQAVNSPIISQPIDFTFTELTKDAKGKETDRKTKLLEPGDYVLEIELLDNVSKAKGLQEFKFKIVP